MAISSSLSIVRRSQLLITFPPSQSNMQQCSSLIAASLYLLSLHTGNGEKLVENGIPDLLLRLAELDDEVCFWIHPIAC